MLSLQVLFVAVQIFSVHRLQGSSVNMHIHLPLLRLEEELTRNSTAVFCQVKQSTTTIDAAKPKLALSSDQFICEII